MVRPDELVQQALQLHQRGNLPQAEPIYRQVLRDQPQHAEARHLLGVLAHQLGRHDEALEQLKIALQLLPNNHIVLNNAGAAYRGLRRFAEAQAVYEKAVRLKPDYVEAHVNLGSVLVSQNKWAEAQVACEKALRLNPEQIDALTSLGSALYSQNKMEEARTTFEKVVRLKPDHHDAWNDLGAVYYAQGKLTEACTCYEKTLRLNPKLAQAHVNLGNVYKDRDQAPDAERCYRKALLLSPNFAMARNNLGNLFREQNKMQLAIEEYLQAIKTEPLPGTWNNLGLAYMIQGRHREADAAFAKVESLVKSDGTRIRRSLLLPVILESFEHLREVREKFEAGLDELLNSPIKIDDPLTDSGMTVFHLAYLGGNDRHLYAKLAQMYLKACPSLHWVAPHCQPGAWTPPTDRPIRVGFLSKYFYNHSVGRHYAGVIKNFSRDGFHVTVLRYPGNNDEMARQISAAADSVVTIPLQLAQAREKVAEQELDILFFPDIGMTPYAYHLAFARLAPVQCVTNGHPVTTGLPEMDYFISCKDIEPADAAEHYTEQVVLMDNIPNFFERPALLGQPTKRSDYGLPDDCHLYLCPQNLCKVHPDFDELVAGILERDPLGRVVFFQGAELHWGEVLETRLRQSIPNVIDRVQILPAQPYHLFLHLLRLADAVLDTTHFGGGTTTAQAMGVGARVVTLPADGMRGRITLGNYVKMGVTDLVAGDREDFVRLAVRLGTDASFRESIRDKILRNNDVLFENPGFVRELEQFFRRAVSEAAHPADKAA
jgi:predicted O-linked N-acetylglucosamine transferase (SPINDLY family)